MKEVIELLACNKDISDYKININKKESFELFFIKTKLETVRKSISCDKEVTIYHEHNGFKGDSQFFIYPSNTLEDIKKMIADALNKALLIDNKNYDLPENEEGLFELESNFRDYDFISLVEMIKNVIFSSSINDNKTLNSVEVFVNKYTETIINSKGINKTQIKYDCMIEAIPTYTLDNYSVELYQQYNFNNFNYDQILKEINDKLMEAEARFKAIKPDFNIDCNVILNKLELAELFNSILYDLNYSSVYSHSNVFKIGDCIQTNFNQDLINMTAKGYILGNVKSSSFDLDGLNLGEIDLIKDGKVVNYYGSNRFGQYLGIKPTGNLGCIEVSKGSACPKCLANAPYLEVLSMSGLQIDFYNDYIGGEIRLAYYNNGKEIIPVTGISFSGGLRDVLNNIRLSTNIDTHDNYTGPDKAILSNVKIY